MLDDLSTVGLPDPTAEGGAVASDDLVFDDDGEGPDRDLAQETFDVGMRDYTVGLVWRVLLAVPGPFGVIGEKADQGIYVFGLIGALECGEVKGFYEACESLFFFSTL